MNGETRTLYRLVLGLAAAVLASVALLVVVFVQLSGVTSRVVADEQRQTANRTANVAVWCTSINRLQSELSAYVAAARAAALAEGHHGVAPLRLTALPCPELERRTLASTKAR